MAESHVPTMATPTDEQLVQTQADLWRHSLTYLTTMALRCAIQLGIPTAIHRLGGAASPADLAAELLLPRSKAPFLGRLMRLLATSDSNVLAASGGSYALTPLSYLLVDGVFVDGQARQSAFPLGVASRHHVEASLGLADWFRKDVDVAAANPPGVPSPFEDTHGAMLFEESMAQLDPEADELFHETLAAHDHMGIGTVLRGCRDLFGGLQSLTDCGGGDGTTARAIVEAFPHIKCTVLDLPPMIEKAPSDGVVSYVAGDLFHSVPPAQAVMLKLVLHFWCDEDCVKILAQCKKAIPSKEEGGKVIIIDIVVGHSSEATYETQVLMDVLVMVVTRGRQRTEEDWGAIFTKAGFSGYKIVKKLGARGIIEVYP